MKNIAIPKLKLTSLLTISACTLASHHALAAEIVALQLDENAGTVSYDTSGNNNNATLHNAIWSDGKSGSALAFDGNMAYAELANEKTNPLYNLHKGNHTIAAWVKPTANDFRSGVITRWGVHQGLFYNTDGTFTFMHRLPSGTKKVTSVLPYAKDKFHHVAVTVNGDDGKMSMYVNGLKVAVTNYTPEQATQSFWRPWHIGVKDTSKTEPIQRESFSGIIDEVMFFDTALSAEEIAQHWGQPENPDNGCGLRNEAGTGTGLEATILEPGDKASGSFISFEQAEVPAEWTTDIGKLSLNTEQAKHGNQSLAWDWTTNAQLEVKDLQSLGLDPTKIDKTNYTQSSFRLWLHNEEVIADDPLRIEFYDDAGNLQYHYYVNLNFTGWRAASVKYRTDMNGDKSSQKLDSMKIIAPANSCRGQLLLDFVDFTADKGVVTGGDYQVPMAATGNTNHWTSNLKYEAYDQPQQVPATGQELNDAEQLKTLYRQMELSGGSTSNLTSAITSFNKLGIRQVNNKILADQPLFGPYHDSFGIKINTIDDIILTFTRDYLDNSNQDSLDRVVMLVRYMLEQGFAAGSLMENSSHIGYSIRSINKAILLLETELKDEGLWQQALDTLAWFNTVEQIWQPISENVSDSDHARTRMLGILGVILHMDDPEKRVHYLKGYHSHLETWLTTYARGSEGIKPDYSSFHHNTQYPGYVYGALGSITTAVRYLSNSSFSISDEKFELMDKMVTSYAVQHAGKDMPLSLSGRNPFKVPTVNTALVQLGEASSSPEQKAKYFGIHNRLYAPTSTTTGYNAEENPTGFWQFNYRPMGVYRSQDWVANIKGVNQYFWGTEIYSANNRYGRYQSYGSIFLAYQPKESDRGNTSFNGMTEAGWDWNKMPGTTTKHLTWSELVAKKSRQDEFSDGTFSAALRFGSKTTTYVDNSVEGECGIHGLDFKQRETISPTHDESFSFKQTVFACYGKLIVLGSNINNTDEQNITATNLFQTSVASTNASVVENGVTHANIGYSNVLTSGNNWLVDPNGTGYYVFAGSPVKVQLATQSTPMQNNKSYTQGDFASAWIDHGAAPENDSYHYVIIPGASAETMQNLSATLTPKGQPSFARGSSYEIVQQDENAHIVNFNDKKTTTYAIYAANVDLPKGLIKSVDTPLLAAVDINGRELNLSLVNPDHNFTGKQPRWGDNQSMPVTLTLKGEWHLNGNVDGVSILYGEEETYITVITQNAAAYDLALLRGGDDD